MTLGERIRTIRQSLKWTQDELAQEAKISKSFLSEIENDKANASGENLLKISNAMNVSMDYLMKGESAPYDKMPQKVEIPFTLSALAEEKGLSYKATLMLLSTHQSLIAKRSSVEKSEMTKEDWWNLYKNLKGYLE
jgi:transcriptional regulator with XRE-family HTH domain